MKPRLLRSGLTGSVYVVTRYRQDDSGNIVAQTKYDVTEDFTRLLDDAMASRSDADLGKGEGDG